MNKLEKAKKRRKAHRGTTTKLLTKIEDALKQEWEKIDNKRPKQHQADLKDKFEIDKFGSVVVQKSRDLKWVFTL